MGRALKQHWPEYLMEAVGLGLFMVSACLFTVLLFHSASPIVAAVPSAAARHMMMGLAMGLTAVFLIDYPWGKRSGAHYNPAVTLTFFRLGKIGGADAIFYAIFQFLGGLAGVLLVARLLPSLISDPSVFYAVTQPGEQGAAWAFVAEFLISFLLMITVLLVSGSASAKWTGVFAGTLIGLYIAFESPLSGMSINPARTVASALPANSWKDVWIYFLAPPLGMLGAGEFYARGLGLRRAICGKLIHDPAQRCIFCGHIPVLAGREAHL